MKNKKYLYNIHVYFIFFLDTPLNSSTSANTSSNSDEFTSFLSASPAPSLNSDKLISNDLSKSGTESSRY